MIEEEKLIALCGELQDRFPGKLFDLSVTFGSAVEVRLLQESQQPSGENPNYDVGCIQTLLEGFIIASLSEDGTIDVHAPIGKYLPELTEEGSRPGNSIRTRDLLAHATGYHAPTGIPSEAGFSTWRKFVEYLSYTKPAFPPGAVCSWNGLGRGILLHLVERATGIPLDELVRRRFVEITGRAPKLLNAGKGWPTLMASIDEIVNYIQVELKRGQLCNYLQTCTVPVVRNPISSRSNAPVGYAFGLALYPDGLWGQTSNGASYNVGVRFNEGASFCLALAIGANSYSRDLILQMLCSACGFVRRSSASHVMGSIIGCELDELGGTYVADLGDVIDVTVADDVVSCSFSRDGVRLANARLSAVNGALLVGDGRWNAHQIEFFRHPKDESVCLTFGQISYVKVRADLQ